MLLLRMSKPTINQVPWSQRCGLQAKKVTNFQKLDGHLGKKKKDRKRLFKDQVNM